MMRKRAPLGFGDHQWVLYFWCGAIIGLMVKVILSLVALKSGNWQTWCYAFAIGGWVSVVLQIHGLYF